MSASFSFGSFGDIITTAQLVWRLARALSDSRGSAPEFRELVTELKLFYGALSQLTKFWQSRAQTAELQRLAAEIHHVADDSCRVIESFLETGLERYGKSFLKPRDSPKTIGDWLKRIRWASLEKEDVAKMRARLGRNKDIIDVIQSVARGHAEEQNSAVVTSRLAELEKAGKLASARLEDNLVNVVGALRDQKAMMSRMDDNVLAMRSESQYTAERLSNIEHTTALLPSIHAGISRYAENHAFIEDALGYKFPVPLIIKPSWETVHSMIKDMFKNRPGMAMIHQRNYVLEDPTTRKDLQSTVEFHGAVRPGQKLIMSMVFHGSAHNSLTGATSSKSVCPKCGKPQMYPDSAGSGSICNNAECGFYYREVLDMSDASEDKLIEWLRGDDVSSHDDVVDESAPDADLSDEETFRLILSKRQAMDDGPEIFKRVRFLSRWEDRDESRGNLRWTVNSFHFWEAADVEYLSDVFLQLRLMTTMHLLQTLEFGCLQSSHQVFPHPKGFILSFQFAGFKRTTAIPAIILVCEGPSDQEQVATALRKLGIIQSSRFGLLVYHPLDLAPREWWLQRWDKFVRNYQEDLELVKQFMESRN